MSSGMAVLLAHLATLTLNEVALPRQGTATFTLLARPTAIREKTFALVDLHGPVSSKRFHAS